MSFVCVRKHKNIPQNVHIQVKTIPCHGSATVQTSNIPGKIILLYDTLLLCMCMYLKITRMQIWP